MPTSFHKHITDVIDYVIKKKPKSVLDIGIGHGKWGFLSREYLDIYGKGSNWKKDTRATIINGIEVYEPYVTENKYITEIYDTIYIGQVEKVYYELNKKYDLVYIMDVVEHLPKREGIKLLENLIKDSKSVIVSVPLGNFLYKFKGENTYESHVSIWEEKELMKYPNYLRHDIYPLICSNGKELKVGVFYFEQ